MKRLLALTTPLLAATCLTSPAFAQQAQPAAPQTVELAPVFILAPTPVPGAIGEDANKIPSMNQTVTSKEFEERHMPSVTDAITLHVPSAVAINVDGSDLSPDFYFRGFDISRISGTSAGLAVYQNGVRINEAFGDLVNLDLIPPIAVDHAEIYTGNPIFGLNALGGALSFTMKNGFNFHGGDATIMGGSYGRANGYAEYGKQYGDHYSLYVAGDLYRDGGYRPFGAQDAERAYADLGYRTQDGEWHVIGSFGRSMLGVQGVTPTPLVNQQYNSVFTTPQTTNNQAAMGQVTSRIDFLPHWSLSSNFYMRQFDQYHVDGNDADVDNCGGTLCLDDDSAPPGTSRAARIFTFNGQTYPFLGDSFPYGSTALSSTHTLSAGTQQQVTNKDTYFGHDNYFVFGTSVDLAQTHFQSSTVLGELNSAFVNMTSPGLFPGSGITLIPAGGPATGFGPTNVLSNTAYYGIFALDTFNITKRLALTAGARFNIANVGTVDDSGVNPGVNASNSYNRINPMVGLTYEFDKAFTVYAGYSEANRAPTPLETNCANPFNPCILETSLVSDPPLQQVVSHTVEAGARGTWVLPGNYGAISYKAGYFRTENDNDIVSEASATTGQGFYVNVPETLRQGVEAGMQYHWDKFNFYANYAFVDATYQFTAAFSSPNNPFANGAGNIIVHPGDHIPGIPSQLAKLGFDYFITPKLKVGADALIVGPQYYVGDDSNQNPQLPLYYTLNLHGSYQVTDMIQIFGLINNVTNNHYYTYGTFFEPDTTGGNVNAILHANNPDNGGPGIATAVTVAQPISFYGGVKVTF